MKKQDLLLVSLCILLFLPFFVSPGLFHAYEDFNARHGMITAFLKFGILSTLGEVIGVRIRTGGYALSGFGVLPRMIVWGFLGMAISMAMTIFSTGTPQFLAAVGVNTASSEFATRLLVAFSISVAMNTIFAPVFMTLHKITDMHIMANGGSMRCFIRPIDMARSFKNINWDVQWGFVFKKTIPFFWYPAHTITFMLPGSYRVLFAALLGVALGIIMAVASLKSNNK